MDRAAASEATTIDASARPQGQDQAVRCMYVGSSVWQTNLYGHAIFGSTSTFRFLSL